MVALAVQDSSLAHESPALLAALNTVFLCGVQLTVALLAARSFRATGSVVFLMLGCGLLSMAVSSLLAGWVMPASGSPNATVTLHNLGALLAGVFHLASAQFLISDLAGKPRRDKGPVGAALSYLGIAVFFLVLAVLVFAGKLPVFFDPRTGASPLRQCVLGGALCLFAVSGFVFLQVRRTTQTMFAYWYGLARLLITVGLGCVLLQKTVGDVLSWTGRGAQYLGSVYFVIAVLRTRREITQVETERSSWMLWPYLEQRIKAETNRLEQANATLRHEVAERQRAEHKLRAALAEAERFRTALDHVSAYVYLKDPQSRYVYANRATLELFGRSAEEMVGCDDTRVFPPDVAKRLREIDSRVFQGERTTEEIEVADGGGGRRVYSEIKTPVYADPERKTVWGLLGISTDITALKKAEKALLASENKYSRLVEGAPDIIYSFSRKRGGIYYSARVEAILGYSVKQLLEHPLLWQNLIDPAAWDGIALAVQKFTTGEPFDLEYRIKDSAGRWHWVRDRSIGRQQVGDDIIIEGIATDITDHKESEATLRILLLRLDCAEDAERRRIARELHDATGQKLAALGMTIGLLQDATSAPAGKTEEMFVNCLTLVEQCAQEIRTHSYLLHPPLLDELGLVAAIRDYAAGYSKRSGVQVTLDAPPNLERLPAEVELAVFRCVQESLGNIHRHAGASTAHIHLACDVEQVIIEVSDQGRGMSPETIRAIEARSGLTGVGIAGMQERVRHLGGRLEIESIGQGTTVRAIIPRQYTAP